MNEIIYAKSIDNQLMHIGILCRQVTLACCWNEAHKIAVKSGRTSAARYLHVTAVISNRKSKIYVEKS